MSTRLGDFFKGPKVPTGPTAAELYRGPAAFSGYETQQSGVSQGNAEQRQAMQGVGEVARTGWTGLDSLAQQQAQRQANLGEKSQRGAVTQQAQMRGQGSGGAMLAGALAAQQGGANRSAESAANLATQGADRRFGATQALGQMGAQYNQQGQQQAASNDAFNQWASGQQTNATMGAYGAEMDRYNAKAAQNAQQWSNLTGVLGAFG